MNIDILLFYFFSIFALISSIMVISLVNAVHSVLFLVLVFCNIAGLLLLLGAEFLSFMLLIVYVGAIAVLFLFVVMMLNVKANPIRINSLSVLPIAFLICFILFDQFFEVINHNFIAFETDYTYLRWLSWISESHNLTNAEVIGNILYTKYSLLFLLCGLILLVAMIGAIVLTMYHRIDIKKQQINNQLVRNSSRVVKFIALRR